MFLGGALEWLARLLDPIDDPAVSLDRHQADDLVLAACSPVLQGSVKIYELADGVFMHRAFWGCGHADRDSPPTGPLPLARARRIRYAYCGPPAPLVSGTPGAFTSGSR